MKHSQNFTKQEQEIQELLAENAILKVETLAVLKKAEWVQDSFAEYQLEKYKVCPCCDACEEDGHEPDCILTALKKKCGVK